MEQTTTEAPVLLNALAWIDKNRKQVILGVIVLALVGSVVGYLKWSAREKELAAGRDLSQAIFSSRQAGQNASEAMLRVAAANPKTAAGEQALLLAGNEQFNAGKYAEAQATFERFRSDYPGSKMVAQAIYGAGTALIAQGKRDEAISAFKDCVDRYPTAPIAAHAKFALASEYEKQNKSDLALPLYQEILQQGTGGSVVNEAAQRAQALLPNIMSARMDAPSESGETNSALTP